MENPGQSLFASANHVTSQLVMSVSYLHFIKGSKFFYGGNGTQL